MLRIGPQIMTLASPLWIAAGSAALLVAIACVLAFGRSRKGFAAGTVRLVFVVLGAGVGGLLTWAVFGNAERNALQARAESLTAQALAPGSALACLNALTGETVQSACESAVFASPASVAAAVSYVQAQFVLLSDISDYARRGGPGIETTLAPLRRTLEADPFGFLAQVLVMSGCTSENCPAFAMLRDRSHVRTNMIAQTLNHYLDHYRDVWARSTDAALAGLSESVPATTAAIGPGKRKVDIDFPTAASIPPISIMNPEPKGPAIPEAARKESKERASGGADPVWTPAPAPAQAAK